MDMKQENKLDRNIVAVLLDDLFNRRGNPVVHAASELIESIDTGVVLSLAEHKYSALPIDTFLILLERFLYELVAIGIVTSIETVESF